jgi:hypothetical protein
LLLHAFRFLPVLVLMKDSRLDAVNTSGLIFTNWFVSQPGYIKSLLVIPMPEENERKIFDAYRWR